MHLAESTINMNENVTPKVGGVVEGDPKAPFTIATIPMYKGGRYSFPWIAPLYPWSLPYNVEC